MQELASNVAGPGPAAFLMLMRSLSFLVYFF